MEFITKFATPNTLATSTSSYYVTLIRKVKDARGMCRNITQRVSSLNHKTLDATMEDMIVEVTIFAMDAEILDSFGAFFAKKLYVNVANCGMKHGRLVYTLSTFQI